MVQLHASAAFLRKSHGHHSPIQLRSSIDLRPRPTFFESLLMIRIVGLSVHNRHMRSVIDPQEHCRPGCLAHQQAVMRSPNQRAVEHAHPKA